MKTIFRYGILSVMLAVFVAAGSVSIFAQDDPCTDTATRDALDKTIRENSTIKTQEARKKVIDSGKEFLEKYGACKDPSDASGTKILNEDFIKWLQAKIPVYEKVYKQTADEEKAKGLEKQFFEGITAKNWNQVYTSGKELLAMDPEKYRPAELVLGSIGLDETAKTPRVNTWNDETLKYARQSIADLEAGKKFEPLGFKPFIYTDKDDALGWMNWTIGYILSFDKNDKKQGVTYLYKATQVKSTTNNIPEVYRSIGSFYIDEMNKRIEELQAMVKAQSPTDSDEVKAQKVAEIKAKQGVVNGTAERALTAFAHAISIASKDTKNAAYTKALTDSAREIYNIRFGKTDGFDTYLATAGAKELVNPTTTVEPVIDPDTSAETPAAAPAAPAKPSASATAPKPGTAAKPAENAAKSKGTRQ